MTRCQVARAAASTAVAPRAPRTPPRGASARRTGERTVRSPNFAASAARRSGWATERSSPVSPISPKQRQAERAARGARRGPRSPPPARPRGRPRARRCARRRRRSRTRRRSRPRRPHGAPSTASTSARRLRSNPLHDPPRRDELRRRDERLDLDEQRPRALHRREHDTARAPSSPRPRTARWHRGPRRGRPSRISKTPTSFVEPKRFLSARSVRYVRSRSPSNCSTQSTRCSSTRGPASEPSFVTCPTRSDRGARALGDLGDAGRDLADLADRARRAVERGGVQRLDRVDHAGLGALGAQRREDGVEVGLGEDRDVERRVAEPLGAQADLGRRTPRRRRRACAGRRPRGGRGPCS